MENNFAGPYEGQSGKASGGRMSEAAVLRDCLDSLKYASLCYLRAGHESDSDGLRKTLDRLAVDKSEQKNAVFNMMRQAGHYVTWPASPRNVADLKHRVEAVLARIGTGQAAERERGRWGESRPQP